MARWDHGSNPLPPKHTHKSPQLWLPAVLVAVGLLVIAYAIKG